MVHSESKVSVVKFGDLPTESWTEFESQLRRVVAVANVDSAQRSSYFYTCKKRPPVLFDAPQATQTDFDLAHTAFRIEVVEFDTTSENYTKFVLEGLKSMVFSRFPYKFLAEDSSFVKSLRIKRGELK